jgi:hypothetical protein
VLGNFRAARRRRVTNRSGRRPSVRRRFCIALLFAGLPVACLSDAHLPPCVEQNVPCMDSAGAPISGGAGRLDDGAGATGVEEAGEGGAESGGGGGQRAEGGGGAGFSGAPTGGSSGGDPAGSGSGGRPLCVTCAIFPDVLPAPCGSDAYGTSLHVVGGTPPYSVSVSAPTADWHVAPDPAHPNDDSWFVLSGTPTGSADLTLEFVGNDKRVFTKPYAIRPRAACWFAYVRLAGTLPELVLVDPILKKVPPITLVNNHGVYDFRFSPNGRFLAYRYDQDPAQPSRAHLALLDLATWQERALAFDSEDAVTAFSWFTDSSVLAVAYERHDSGAATSTTYLGGVRLSLASPPLQPVNLTPVQAYVESDLYWVGQDSVAFHAALLPDLDQPGQFIPNPLRLRTPYYAKLGMQGFDAPKPNVSFVYNADAALTVQPTADGFYMISAHDPYANFYPVPAILPAAGHWTNVVSPGGTFSAAVVDSQLQLFRATDGSDIDPFVVGPAAFSCPYLLTVAKGKQRLACVANVEGEPSGTAHGEIRVFDLDASSLTSGVLRGFCLNPTNGIAASQCAALEYDYDEQRSQQQARAFSSSGNWLAFSTSAFATSNADNYLYLADLRSSTFVMKRKDPSDVAPATSHIALAFSPDERYLIQQRDVVLTVHDVPVTGSGWDPQKLPTPAKHAPLACSEDFTSARDRWCGDARTTALLAWSPESRSFAYRTSQGLAVVDLDGFPTTDTRIFLADECQGECSNQFDFQPQP